MSKNPLDDLPDSEVFSRDPEAWDSLTFDTIVSRIKDKVSRLRKVRLQKEADNESPE